uniref:Ig-like domain-containing protein n=1 Tax=Poecilia reticulata TaxID=8081 RepID=A0A3P9N1D8_POERE
NVYFTPLRTLLMCFISVSVCQFHTVSVRPAEDVTLMCSNFSKFFSHVFWFKMNSSPNASRISAMLSAESNVSLSDGFHFSKYNMTSNITNLFLKIKEVNFSDSGLYFCGQYVTAGEAPVPAVFTATHLQVEGKMDFIDFIDAAFYVSDRLLNLPRMILGCVAVFLTVVIVALVVKIRTIQNGQAERTNLQPSENLDPDGLNYEVLHIRPKAKNKRRPADEKNLKDNVLYAATR